MTRKTLAIIGGGSAGHKLAHQLQHQWDVTLIDPKTYFEVPMALPRLLAAPQALPAQLPYTEFLQAARLVQGHATAIGQHHLDVRTAHGLQRIAFDYAVLATGSRAIDPLIKAEAASLAQRQQQIAAAHQQLLQARSVVVVGGGPVGVEITAELADRFPQLAITLVHGQSRLLETAPPRFAGWALQTLQERGIQVLLDDPVVCPRPGQPTGHGLVETRSGRTVPADMVLWASGTRPNTECVATSWPELVQPDGLLKTDQYLRLQGHENIFVAGDITNQPEARLALTAAAHVDTIRTNLTRLARHEGQSARPLRAYRPRLPGRGMGKLMIVTLGKQDGLSSLPFGQFRTPWLARKIKAEQMFVNHYRKDLGLR